MRVIKYHYNRILHQCYYLLGFPNASKKNRPNLKNGQAVYARVSQDIPEIETELECIDPTSGKEGGFGCWMNQDIYLMFI